MTQSMKADLAIDPQLGYFLVRADHWSDLKQRVFTKLYQPLLDPNAFTLYLTLWSEVDDHQLISQRSAHFRLFDLVGLDAPTFLHARQELEACGLMKTFKQHDTLGDYLIYQLFAPLAPAKFFQEEILATFLLEKVSRAKFMALQREFQLPDVSVHANQEITAGFLDVFHLSTSALLTPPAEVHAGAAKFKDNQPTAYVGEISPAELASFDWETLIALVGRQQIEESEILTHKNDIYGLQKFYGFTVTDIARLIGRSINLETNKINFNMLEERALALYQQLNPTESKPTNEPAESVKPASVQGFSEIQLDLLKRANELTPADFLRETKQRQQSYAAENEYRNVKKLQQRGVLNDATINIMLNTVLSSYTTLTQALIDTFAQDWLKQGIKTPEAALKYLAQKQTAPLKQQHRSQKRQQPAGVTPNWFKKGTQDAAANQTTDSKQRQQIAQKLANLNKTSQQRGE